MKEKIVEVDDEKLVVVGKKNKIVYETNDGLIFEDKKVAIQHETIKYEDKRLKDEFLYHTIDDKYKVLFIRDINNEIESFLRTKISYTIDKHQLSLGWNILDMDDSGDSTYIRYYTPEKLILSFEVKIKGIEFLIQKIKVLI